MAILATLVASVILGQDRSFPVGKVNLSGATEVTGDPFKLQEPAGPCSVLIFLSHDCPIANRYAPEIKRIYNEYIEKKIPFYRVYLGSAEHYADTAVKHGNDYGLEFPIVLDPNKKLVEALNISVTPEVAVISKDYKLLYRGRIDDQVDPVLDGCHRTAEVLVELDIGVATDLRHAQSAAVPGSVVDDPIVLVVLHWFDINAAFTGGVGHLIVAVHEVLR